MNILMLLQGRDMSIAYILVTATYMLIGASFYIAFPLPKSCIEDVSKIIINIITVIFKDFQEYTTLKNVDSQSTKNFSVLIITVAIIAIIMIFNTTFFFFTTILIRTC